MTTAIETRALRKTFGPKVAVESLDLSIAQGELIGLIGPNGAGKTTTIRMVMSIIFPDSGELSVLGRKSAIESKDRIGYLPEERGLYKKMKVGEFLVYVARLKGLSGPDVPAKAGEWLERVGLGETWKKKCEELSKGMQQKVQFIASVIHEPDLLILDEPFSGLDPVNSRLLRELILEQHRAGRTVIFSTHQMTQAEALCDRVVMIHQGRKVLDNTPREVRERFDPRAVMVVPAGFANGQAERMATELTPRYASVAGVADVQRVGLGLVIHVREGHSAGAVLQTLAPIAPVERIEIVRPTLEDVFIEIVAGRGTTQDERDRLLGAVRGQDGGGD